MLAVFDSGVGGLSVLRELRAQLPAADLLYLADQAHVPYGPRPAAEIRAFAEGLTRWLLEQGAQTIVVACNTASAVALRPLRAAFPGVPFVGMEPAVKPAAARSRARAVGVIATPVTFQGELFASVVDRFARGVQVLPQTCPGLVEQIEAGDLDGPRTRAILRAALAPLLEAGIDSLVLGCTHYAFVLPALAEIAGPGVEIIDPSPAVARQAARVYSPPKAGRGRLQLVSTGDVEKLVEFAGRCAGLTGEAARARWQGPTLAALPPAIRAAGPPPPA
jgi:glutamate racemase